MELKFELKVEAGEKSLDVRSFDIHEQLSTLYEVNVVCRSPNPDIDLETIVGKAALLTIHSGNPELNTPLRTWEGTCSSMQLLKTEEEPGAKGVSTYALQIVPRMWLMHHNREHRIFQRIKIPDLVEKLLGEWEVEVSRKLSSEYKELDYVTQYGESDFSFVSRLLERAGITYYFDHSGGKPGVLTLHDAPHTNPPRPPIKYNHKLLGRAAPEHCSNARIAERVAPGRYTIKDFDFRRPDFHLVGEAPPAKAPEDFYEQYHYDPGASVYLDPSGPGSWPVADDKGKVRWVDQECKGRAERGLEAERCRKRMLSFETNCVDLFPGTVFKIEEHPRADVGKPILVSGFSLQGSTGEAWLMLGEALFAEHPYRPVEETECPTIRGLQSAFVVGPSGEEIYTDEHGRVRVQFHWDRDGKMDPESSCWMRVSQSWAGGGFGKIMVPRVGQEVLVSYLDGDPDRPIIVGRKYNGTNLIASEQELPRYKTRSSWKSDTSPHEDNSYNELRFEDAIDDEFVYTQAQRDQQKLVKGNETERTGRNRATLVGGNRAVVVGAVDATLVGKKYSLQMIDSPKPADLQILQMGKPTVSPLSTKVEMIDKKILCTSGEATVVIDGGDAVFEAKQLISFKAGGNIVVKGGPNNHINPKAGGSAQAGCLVKGSGVAAPFVQKAK
jgi:type VI secretion system secreted protein VgrG